MICRLCNNQLSIERATTLKGMPSLAQYLPQTESDSIKSTIDLAIIKCSICQLVQTLNPPAHYFRESIRNSKLSPELMNWRMSKFSSFVKQFGLENKNLLEVGCGEAELLDIFKKLKLNVFGTEFNYSSLALSRAKGFEVWRTYPLEKDFLKLLPVGYFDAFITSQFLEHSPQPRFYLERIRATLKEGAVGIVEVPNYSKIERENLLYEFMTDHVTYFTGETLTLLLNSCGFSVISLETHFDEYVLTAYVKRESKQDLSNYLSQLELDREHATMILAEIKRGKVVFWGAGHQAFAAIHLLGLTKHISYLVDSAEEKQEKFVPGTSLRILKPEILLNDKAVTHVIVAAGGYNNEIIRILKSRLDNLVQILEFKSGVMKVVSN